MQGLGSRVCQALGLEFGVRGFQVQGSVEDLGFGESGPAVRTSICCLQGQTLAGSTGRTLGPDWAFATTRMRFLVGYIYICIFIYLYLHKPMRDASAVCHELVRVCVKCMIRAASRVGPVNP